MDVRKGSIRWWVKGSNFRDQLVELILITKTDVFCFSGYVDADDFKWISKLLAPHWGKLNVTKDLKKAHVYLSIFGSSKVESILEKINKNSGYLRKAIASRTKLKYNPLLIFSIDPVARFEKTINELLEDIKQNEK